MTQPESTRPRIGKGPSREMLGGPLLGVAVFLVIAVLLGWGLTKLFNLQLAGTTHDADSAQVADGFDPDTVYVLQRDLLVGRTTGGTLVLYPSRDDLPRETPNRQYTPTIAEYHADPTAFPDVAAVIPVGTRVRFPRLTFDTHNPQTAVLVDAVILDGRYAEQRVTALHLDHTEIAPDGERRITPRDDLLRPERSGPAPSDDADEPIQSPAPDAEPEPAATDADRADA